GGARVPGIGRDRAEGCPRIRVAHRALPVPRVARRQQQRGCEQEHCRRSDETLRHAIALRRNRKGSTSHSFSPSSKTTATAHNAQTTANDDVISSFPRASAPVGSEAVWKIACGPSRFFQKYAFCCVGSSATISIGTDFCSSDTTASRTASVSCGSS